MEEDPMQNVIIDKSEHNVFNSVQSYSSPSAKDNSNMQNPEQSKPVSNPNFEDHQSEFKNELEIKDQKEVQGQSHLLDEKDIANQVDANTNLEKNEICENQEEKVNVENHD